MKRILFILMVLVCGFISQAQYPIQQSVGNAPNTKVKSNAIHVADGFINGVFADTTAANLKQIKTYPGAQIFTTSDSAFWLRNPAASRWMRSSTGAGSIVSFNFITDSSLIICYGDGTCDTIPIYNFTEVVTNIVQNYNDSSVYNLNDSTIIICTGSGDARVCDTISLGSTNTYYFTITGDTLITCDLPQIICVGDSCYQQELCDTIVLAAPLAVPVYQNLLQKLPSNTNIREFGAPYVGNSPADMLHDTWIFTNPYQLTLTGRASGRPNFMMQQTQWSQTSSSILGINHNGAYTPNFPLPDLDNPVNLYFNYTDRFVIPTTGSLAGDTLGFMYDRYGYLLMTNSQGTQNAYTINDEDAKQVGMMFHTFDTDYTDAITLFGNQTPLSYSFSNNPASSVTLLDSRIAVFHTDKSSNFLGKVYLTDGRFELDEGTATAAANDLTLPSDGNLFHITGATQINAITTANWQDGSQIAFIFDAAPLVKNNTAGGAGTATLLLAGRTDFQAAAGDYLQLQYDGTNWYETNRSIAATAPNINIYNSDGTVLTDRIATLAANTLTFTANTLAGDPAISITSTSTAASGDLQKGLNVSLIGANSNSNQDTYGVYSSNTHTGSGSVNYGLYGVATSGGTNYGVYGNATTVGVYGTSSNIGVQGVSTSVVNPAIYGTNVNNIGVHGQGVTGVVGTGTTNGILGQVSGASAEYAIQGHGSYTSRNDAKSVFELIRSTSHASFAGVGMGAEIGIYMDVDDGIGGTYLLSNKLTSVWANSTSGAQTSQLDVAGVNTASTTTIASFYGSGVVGIGITSGYTATRLDIVDNTATTQDISSVSSTSLTTGSGLLVSINGTGALTGQKGIEVNLQGANASGSQVTYGIYSHNQHTGASATTNIGVYGLATNGISGSAGVYGQAAAGQLGVRGASSSGYGLYGTSSSGNAIYGETTSGTFTAELVNNPSSTNTTVSVIKAVRTTTGTAADGIAGAIDFYVEDDDGGVGGTLSGSIVSKWTTAANATRTSSLTFQNVLSGTTVDALILAGDGSIKLRPITATAASAITPAEGLLVFVSDTDATFVSIGIWCYQNGAWKAL